MRAPGTSPAMRPDVAVDEALIGIIRNPRSHRNKIRSSPHVPAAPHVIFEAPRNRAELRVALADFAQKNIRFLAISGGDGTVRDVLTCGYAAFGDNWPELIVLPRGKTNALAVDLGIPAGWSMEEALQSARRESRIERRPMVIRSLEAQGAEVLGFVLGTGAFAMGTDLGQEAHRKGAFQSFAVGVTILWAVLQIVFGGRSNKWRSTVRMELRDGLHGPEFPHSRRGDRARRFLMLASTLERFPLGVRPFGRRARKGIKVAMMDSPLRRWLLLLPVLLTGLHPRIATRDGFLRTACDSLLLDIEDRFVVDGEFFPAGRYLIERGPKLSFVVP